MSDLLESKKQPQSLCGVFVKLVLSLIAQAEVAIKVKLAYIPHGSVAMALHLAASESHLGAFKEGMPGTHGRPTTSEPLGWIPASGIFGEFSRTRGSPWRLLGLDLHVGPWSELPRG